MPDDNYKNISHNTDMSDNDYAYGQQLQHQISDEDFDRLNKPAHAEKMKIEIPLTERDKLVLAARKLQICGWTQWALDAIALIDRQTRELEAKDEVIYAYEYTVHPIDPVYVHLKRQLKNKGDAHKELARIVGCLSPGKHGIIGGCECLCCNALKGE